MKQLPNLTGIIFKNVSYLDLEIPKNSIIYCDPPYQKTTKYKHKIDYDIFWEWVRNKVKKGHTVYISEYDAPDDFISVWEKETVSTFKTGGKKEATEKLFIHKTQI